MSQPSDIELVSEIVDHLDATVCAITALRGIAPPADERSLEQVLAADTLELLAEQVAAATRLTIELIDPLLAREARRRMGAAGLGRAPPFP